MADKSRPPSSNALSAYVAVVVAAGLAVVAASFVQSLFLPNRFGWLGMGALALVATSFRLRFASVSANISIADTFFIMIAVMWGPAPAALALALSGLLISLRRRHPWWQVSFNLAAPAFSLWSGAQVFFFVAGIAPLHQGGSPVGDVVLPLGLLTAVYFVFNSGLTAIAVAIDARQQPLQVWRNHFSWLSVSYFAAASVAFCLILVIQQVGVSAVVVVLPLLAVFHLTLRASFGRLEDAQKHLGDLDRLYLSTVETLAMAIDAKDDVTHSHVRRVQAYAVGLARALGIESDEEIKALKAAALLHDTGKLGVPEHILNKPGKLTESEFEKMKQHVDIGADILSLVEFPYPVVPIVRCHHENWDGSGYPRGVKGDQIPIGARILSVVDCFDALTSDRPYRRALTNEAALAILRERSGTMYDPRVVDAFVAVYRDITLVEDETEEQRDVMRRITASRAERVVEPDSPPAAQTAASSDVLAFVSLARIASGDGGVADILALSSNLISDIMPNVTGAWYLPDAGRTKLAASEPFGPSAASLRGVQIIVGQRLTGWVAASRQAVVNSDAALDLDPVDGGSALRSCMSVPLLAGDTLVGVLTLYSPDSDSFTDDRGRLLQMIAPHIAGAVQSAARNAAAAPEKSGSHVRDLRLVSTR